MKLLILLSATLSVTSQLVPRNEPKAIWTATVPPAQYGNECKIYGQDALLICTGADGSTTAVSPTDAGKQLWAHTPAPKMLSTTRSTSGVAFGSNPTTGDYIVHAVTYVTWLLGALVLLFRMNCHVSQFFCWIMTICLDIAAKGLILRTHPIGKCVDVRL